MRRSFSRGRETRVGTAPRDTRSRGLLFPPEKKKTVHPLLGGSRARAGFFFTGAPSVMMRLLAQDEQAEKAAGLHGRRRRVAPLDEEKALPPLPEVHRRAPAHAPMPPNNAANARSLARRRNERRLRELQENGRIPTEEAREAYKQVHDLSVHEWLKKRSVKAVPRTELRCGPSRRMPRTSCCRAASRRIL